MLRKSSMLLAVIFLMVASSIQANNIVPENPGAASSGSGILSLGIGPQLGFYNSRDADNGRLLYGAAIRLKILSSLGAEGSINYRQEDYANGDLIVRSWPVMVTGLFYPLPFIYGAVGGGWYNTTFDYKDELNRLGVSDKTKQLFGWHLGAGVELPLGSSTKLTGDIRYVFLNYNVDKLNTVPITSIKSDFYAITVGLMFGL